MRLRKVDKDILFTMLNTELPVCDIKYHSRAYLAMSDKQYIKRIKWFVNKGLITLFDSPHPPGQKVAKLTAKGAIPAVIKYVEDRNNMRFWSRLWQFHDQ